MQRLGRLSSEPIVQSLAKEDPELEFLCPFLKALYLLEVDDCRSFDAAAALRTCWFIDDSMIFREKEWKPGEIVEGREIVKHSTLVFAGGESFLLGFDSVAEFLFCSRDRDLIVASTAAKLLRRKSEADAFANPRHLCLWLESKSERPIGYPEGEDEPLCLISHRLTSINEIAVHGPTMSCGYHETTIDDFGDGWETFSRPEELCWLHALNAELAGGLGIGSASQAQNNRPSHSHPNHPSWLSEVIDIEATWLDAEQLQESYSCGRRIRIKDAPIRLALGCGEDWTPKTYAEEEESCDPCGKRYPLVHPPILNIEIHPDAGSFPDAVEKLRPYLLRLAEIAEL